MPLRDKSGIGERVPRELIDADFEVAFSLVDMARIESGRGNGPLAAQLLNRSGKMLKDIEERLLRLTAERREPFASRCAELARAIEQAEPGE